MLPRSCLRELLSKSNSSTRWPSSTTTRVSSGWAASISIFFDIKSLSGALGGPEVRAPAWGAREDADRPRAAKSGGRDRVYGVGGAAHGLCVLKARVSDGRGSDGASRPEGQGPTPARAVALKSEDSGCANCNVGDGGPEGKRGPSTP